MADGDAPYLLSNAIDGARERLDALAAMYDAWTLEHLDRVGVGAGWRCWEVGAGGPSIVRALATRVGPTGTVLATDLDSTWAAGASTPSVEVRVHDVAADPIPSAPFDLVHARLVLVHVPDRDTALANMIAALRPGGWLVIEDADPALQPLSCLDDSEDAALANRIRSSFRSLMADRGVDLAYGRTLPGRLRGAGLEDVRADAFFPVSCPESQALELATLPVIREHLVAAGLVEPADIDRHLRSVALGTVQVVQPPLVTAWGRRTVPASG